MKHCSKCQAVGFIEGHHPSYLFEHRFDVEWLCKAYHEALHSKEHWDKQE